MLERAEQLIPPLLLPKLPPSKPKWSTEPEWRAFEYALWRLGEEIRQVTARYKAARFTPEQLRRVLAVAVHPRAQRGRQSFILLLGYKKYQDCAAALARQLADPDVTGQVIDTLYKMQAAGYAAQIQPYLQDGNVRRYAKRYLAKYGDGQK